MMASTHITVAIAGYVAYCNIANVPIQAFALAVAGIAALLADIDHPQSAFGKTVPFISIPLSLLLGHRGITHSLIAGIVLALLAWLYSGYSWVVMPFAIGYLSHIGADVLSNSGAPLLWPYKKRISFPLFNTGSIFEVWFRFAVGLFTLWLIWVQISHDLFYRG